MKFWNFIRFFAILLATSRAALAIDQPIKVTVNDLFKHPKNYNGKRVEVTGYWVTSCAHCSDLYPSFEEEQRKPYGKFVSIGALIHATMPRAFRRMSEKSWGNYDGYARVIGTFRFTPIPDWVGKPIPRQPQQSPEAREIQTPSPVHERVPPIEATAKRELVWGWNGPPEKQIVAVTLFQPIGPPTPSHIDKYDEEQVRKGLEETEKLRRAGKLPPWLSKSIPSSATSA